MSHERTNDEWLAALRADGPLREEATAELRRRLSANLRPMLARRGLSPDCLDDVVQETILRLMSRLDSFRGDSKLITWVTAIGVRTGLELLRRQEWCAASFTESSGDASIDPLAYAASPEESAERHARRREILDALSRAIRLDLTERQRRILLGELQGMPISQVAEGLGGTRGAVYKAGHDGRRKLKAALERDGFDAESVREILNG